jgi:hypothetical protein
MTELEPGVGWALHACELFGDPCAGFACGGFLVRLFMIPHDCEIRILPNPPPSAPVVYDAAPRTDALSYVGRATVFYLHTPP